jgi:hypothetical protein
MTEFVCEYVAKHLSGCRAEITALREQVAALQLEAAYQRGVSDRARGVEVIDLPAMLPKRGNGNGLNG